MSINACARPIGPPLRREGWPDDGGEPSAGSQCSRCLGVAAEPDAAAADPVNSISGRVTNAEGEPLTNVSVTAYGQAAAAP